MYLKEGLILNNRYEVQRVLGQGGFGITYLAIDRVLNLPVAIKEYLPRQLAGRSENQSTVMPYTGAAREHYDYGLKKFLEEARVLARFSQQPGIVSVRDYFEANNTAYMVMEFIQGQTLKEYLNQHGEKISWDLTLRIMLPVLEALEQVHVAGLLHRDVSPDNILLTVNGQVKLLDFGAARYFAGEHSRSLSVILKPGYAPEEQYRSGGKQGAWTDVYGAAATMYRALTGTTPPESLDRLAEDTLVPPSRLGIALPAFGETSLLKALTVKGSQRFQSIRAFRESLMGKDLESQTRAFYQNPTSAPAATVSSGQLQLGRRRQSRMLVVLGLAVTIVLFMGTLAFFWSSGKTPSGNQAQKTEYHEEATTRPQTLESSSRTISPGIGQGPAKNLKEEFLKFAGLGDELRQKGDYNQAIQNYSKAIELIPDFSDWIYNNRGLAYLKLGDYKSAVQDFDHAITLNPEGSYSYNNRAVAYHGLNDFQQAQKDLLQAQRLGHRINQEFLEQVTKAAAITNQEALGQVPRVALPALGYNPALAKILCNEGRQLYKQGKYAEAIEKLEVSVQHDPGSAFCQYLLGWSYHQVERSPELALAAFQAAVRLKPDYALAYDGLTWTYNKLGRYQDALKTGKKTLQLNYNFPDAHYNLGMAYLGLGQLDQAMQQYHILQKMNKDKADLLLRNIQTPMPTNNSLADKRVSKDQVTAEEIRQFISNYYQTTARGNVNELLSFYADFVNYYSIGRVNKSVIRQDKDNYFKRWPMQLHNLFGDIKITNISDATKKVEFSTNFQVKNNAKTINGLARCQWLIQKSDGRMAIIDEKSQVVRRE